MEIRRTPFLARLALACIGAELLIVACDLVFAYFKVVPVAATMHFFNATRETGLSNWFSSTQTLFVGLTIGVIFVKERSSGWLVLASFFVYMAFDDATKFHERLGTTVRVLSQSPAFQIFPSYSWQVVLGPLFFGMGIFIVLFTWRRLDDWISRGLVFFGLGCLVLAVGLDFVEGLEENPYYLSIEQSLSLSAQTVKHLARVLEEFIEMLGTTFLWMAFLRKLTSLPGEFRLRFL